METWLAKKFDTWHNAYSPGGKPPEIYHAQRIVRSAIDYKIFETDCAAEFCEFIVDRLEEYTERDAVPHTRKAITWLKRDLKDRYEHHAAEYESARLVERDRQNRLAAMAEEKRREEEEQAAQLAAEDARFARAGHLKHYRTARQLQTLMLAISLAESGMTPVRDEDKLDIIDIELVAAANSEYIFDSLTWDELVAKCQTLPCWNTAHYGATH